MTATEIALLPPEEFTRQIWALYRQALPDPDNPTVFNGLIREANSKGMRYVEALLYVIDRRRVAIDQAPLAAPVFDEQPCLSSLY